MGPLVPNKHLLILGIRGVPAQHGGFESFAERLAPWMVQAGWRVTVYCQGSATGTRHEDTWKGCRRVHVPVNGDTALSTIEFDIKSTREAVGEDAIMLTLGYNTGFLSVYARMRGCFNLINMDGIEWKRAKYSAAQKAYLWLNERLAAISGNVLIADHPEILRHHTGHSNPDKLRMIPYGSDRIESADENLLERFALDRDRFFTVIARPEPENSILEIVRAFSRKPRGAKLAVLGKYHADHAYQNSVMAAAGDEVVFLGAIYDKPSLNALRLFGIAYIHGHQVGGTNPSLVEAMGAGNAVIAHDNPFNRWVAGDGALFFADEEQIETHVENLIHVPAQRDRLREQSLLRWSEEFRWDIILKDYQSLIESVI